MARRRHATIVPVPTIEANGLTIGYEVAGDGPPLIMLHSGGGSGPADLDRQRSLLASAFRVYLPDARGHAGTRWDVADGFSTELMVDDLFAFAEALGLTTFHLLGFSMGAMTALTAAVRHPEILRSLVTISITPAREPRLSVVRHALDPERIEREEPAWAAQLAARHDPTQGTGAWRRLLPAIVDDVATQPLVAPSALRAIEVPTLVCAGDRDPFVPVGEASLLSRQVLDGRLFVAPDTGHDVPHTAGALLDEVLTSFYRTSAKEEQP